MPVHESVEELQKLKEKCQTELTEAENTLATVQKAENSSRRLIGQFEISSVSQDVSQSIVRDSVVHLNNEKSPTLQLNEQQRINRKADRETKNLPKFTDEELQSK
uniref:Uncharacterized protein n=1 Tax=Schistosoma haematobium TaxID=6185 RepID=A0A094ZTN0_SCHHA